MMSSRWIAIGPDGLGWTAYAVSGQVAQKQSRNTTLQDTRSALGFDADHEVHIDTGEALALPAQILPQGGPDVPPLIQQAPVAQLSGWSRLAIAGFLSGHAGWDGVVCLAGPENTLWCLISADEVVSVQGFVTGALIQAMQGATAADAEALAGTLSQPERLAAHLYGAQLVNDKEAITGHLTGAELAAARPYWLGQQVAVIGQPDKTGAYAQVLIAQGIPADTLDYDAAIEAGLAALAIRFDLCGG